MPQLIFTFTVNTDTKQSAWSGNLLPHEALPHLQSIALDTLIELKKQEAEQVHKSENKEKQS
jgi:hypothetical protein